MSAVPGWNLTTMVVQGDVGTGILSAQVRTDSSHTGFVGPQRNAQSKACAPERLTTLGGVPTTRPCRAMAGSEHAQRHAEHVRRKVPAVVGPPVTWTGVAGTASR